MRGKVENMITKEQRKALQRFQPNTNRCKICWRIPLKITRHHLVPVDVAPPNHRHRKVKLCRSCHAMLHTLFDNVTLARDFDHIEKILAHDGIRRFAEHVAKNPVFDIYGRAQLLKITQAE